MAKTTNLLAAFLGGAAAGALVGILLAPDSGAETRRKIVRAKDRSVDYLDDLVQDGKKTWNDTRNSVLDRAGVAANDVDDFVRHILDRGRAWWKKGKKEARRMADDAEEKVDRGTRTVKEHVNRAAGEVRKTAERASDEAERMADRASSEAGRMANNMKDRTS